MAPDLLCAADMIAHPRTLTARTQAAIVRTLIDEFEQSSIHGEPPQWLHAQLIEEFARLGRQIIELATALAETCPWNTNSEQNAAGLRMAAPRAERGAPYALVAAK